MENLERAYRDLVFERNRFRDAKAEEFLGYDAELIKLYYLQKRRYGPERALHQRLMELADVGNPLFSFAIWISRYKDVAERAKRLDDLEGVANDVADAFDHVIEQLQTMVVDIRQQVAALPPLGEDDVMQRVGEAGYRAFREAEQQYGERLSKLRRLIVSQSKNSDSDSAL